MRSTVCCVHVCIFFLKKYCKCYIMIMITVLFIAYWIDNNIFDALPWNKQYFMRWRSTRHDHSETVMAIIFLRNLRQVNCEVFHAPRYCGMMLLGWVDTNHIQSCTCEWYIYVCVCVCVHIYIYLYHYNGS